MLDYIAGLVVGNGHLYRYAKEGKYYVRISDRNREFLEKVRKMLGELGVRSHIYKITSKNCYVLEFTRKELFYEISKRMKQRLRRPTIDFVRGIVDAEGSLQVPRQGSVRITISNTSLEVLESVNSVLKKVGFSSKIVKYGKPRPGEKQRYRIVIYGRRNVEAFIEKIKPLHPKFADVFTMPPIRRRESGNERDPRP